MYKKADWKGIGGFRPGNVMEGYRTATVNPIGSTIAMAGAAAIPAYFAAPYIGRKFIETVVPEQYREEALADFNDPENQKNLKWKGAGLAAAMTALMHAGVTYNPARGLKSYTSWRPTPEDEAAMNKQGMLKEALQYYLNGPGTFGDNRIFGQAQGMPGLSPVPFNQNTAPLFGVGRGGGGGDTDSLLYTPVVPLSHATELIETDPYLNNRQKGVILNIFDHTEQGGKSGLVSVHDLAAAGTRAGMGYAAGSVAGLVLGSIFSLPTKVTQKMSRIGGIANAVVNTGIVGV